MPDEVEVVDEPEGQPIDSGYLLELQVARQGLRTCLTCRTSFPNHLAVVKHQLHGCRKALRKTGK
jgi:hypothetical protein